MTYTGPDTPQKRWFLKKGVTAPLAGADAAAGPLPAPWVLAVAKAVSSALYVGYIPVAQGTFGALWGVAAYLPVLFAGPEAMPPAAMWYLFVLTVVVYFAGVWSAGVSEIVWGHDPGRVVIDEVLGMLAALLFLPVTAVTLTLGFFLFRAFDILKPAPVYHGEFLPRGWGVMTDDLFAGIYANIVLRIIVAVATAFLGPGAMGIP